MTSYEKNKEAAKLGEKLYRDSKIARYFGEMLIFYIPLLIVWVIIAGGNDLFDVKQTSFLFDLLMFIPPMILQF